MLINYGLSSRLQGAQFADAHICKFPIDVEGHIHVQMMRVGVEVANR
jgi:hypothetical protein